MTHLAPRAALCALALTLLAAAPAAAQSDIEAVWEFNGGQVAVERQADGTFLGTVVRPTQLSQCVHQNGERMWTEVRAQPDGQYFGLHQYFRTSDCSFIERGMVALRVLRNAQGQTFLRVCFDDPERSPDEQPNIAPDGSNTSTDDGCRDSTLVSPLPREQPKLKDIVSGLPPQKKGCSSRRRFPIRLKEPPGDALAGARITLNRKRLRVVRSGGRLRSVVDLRGLPRGRYALKIVATTVRGRTIQGTRRYRTCGKKRRIGNVGPI
ncbi:MAG TPA: hypothetical protein VHF89_15670 [Solirubrobacteraceae bacterium]|nr:hypothetical protein [Solirubrobacteraceae bacterium]